MALLPSTADRRMVPVAGRQFAERRKIRGVGAAERALGNAWGTDHMYGGMDSKARAAYGSQKNFARKLQRTADTRAAEQEASREEALRQQGRDDAMAEPAVQEVTTAEPALKPYRPMNHAENVLGRSLRKARLGKPISMGQSGQDR